MNLKLLKLRAEMLDAVSIGLQPSALVGQLAEKYGVSERCLWNDWERRLKPSLFSTLLSYVFSLTSQILNILFIFGGCL